MFALNADIATGSARCRRPTPLAATSSIGTVDLSGDAVQAIIDGEIAFAIDQQQYAQGYLPVVLLYLNKINGNVLGGGKPMYTGPGFVTKDNAEQVQKLAAGRHPLIHVRGGRAPLARPGPHPARTVGQSRHPQEEPVSATIAAPPDERLAKTSRASPACSDVPSSARSWAPSSSTSCSPPSTPRASSPPSQAPPAGPTSASTVGIVAVPVALLMIAGEFDLSAGVMVGTSGLFCGLLTTEYDVSMWPAILLTFAFAACIGLINGWLVMLTGLPSFIVTLAMFFSLRGINLGVTKSITDTVRVAGVDKVDGFDSARKVFASTFWNPYDYRIAVVWWIGITAGRHDRS